MSPDDTQPTVLDHHERRKYRFESNTTCFPAHGMSALLFAVALLVSLPTGAHVTDASGLTISSLYAVFPVLRRNYTLTLAADV